MDLQDRQQPQLASRFLNSYLEATGDYAGLAVMPFYLCYRAVVRAKVDALRLAQTNLTDEQRLQTRAEFASYLRLASTYTQKSAAKLIIMRGLSASGKSTVSRQLVDAMGMIRIRSDVERKRLFSVSLDPEIKSSSNIDAGIYSASASSQTYAKLAELARQVINSGFSVIVDAAFLKQEQRQPFQQLAARSGAAYLILEISAPEAILRQRISEKRHDVSDADLAVLEHQLAHWKPLPEDEKSHAITVSTAAPVSVAALIKTINKRVMSAP
jgi:predicted kinase